MLFTFLLLHNVYVFVFCDPLAFQLTRVQDGNAMWTTCPRKDFEEVRELSLRGS